MNDILKYILMVSPSFILSMILTIKLFKWGENLNDHDTLVMTMRVISTSLIFVAFNFGLVVGPNVLFDYNYYFMPLLSLGLWVGSHFIKKDW